MPPYILYKDGPTPETFDGMYGVDIEVFKIVKEALGFEVTLKHEKAWERRDKTGKAYIGGIVGEVRSSI